MDYQDPPFRIRRGNKERKDGLSSSLQVGKAAEFLVCSELILKGYNATVMDAGQPYDVLVDLGGGCFVRIQVKSTTRMYEGYRLCSTYRFPMRKSRTGERRVTTKDVDVFAFVALDARQVAWMSVHSVSNTNGYAKQLMSLKTRRIVYERKSRGVDPNKVGKFMEDYADFAKAVAVKGLAKKRVYLAGPISKGDLTENVNQATEAFVQLAKAGLAPFCPQWSVYSKPCKAKGSGVQCLGTQNGNSEMVHSDWLGVDIPWVEVSDVVLRLSGESIGADAEVAHAKKSSIPVFESVAEVIEWAKAPAAPEHLI